MGGDERRGTVLIPVSKFVDKARLAKALYTLSAFRRPRIVLFHVVELKSRTAPVDLEPFKEHVEKARKFLEEVSGWLEKQGYEASVKVAVARSAADGITEEANSRDYDAIIMMKRRARKGVAALLHRSVSASVIKRVKRPVLVVPTEF